VRGCDAAWCGVSVAVNVAFDVVAVANDTLAVMSAANVAFDVVAVANDTLAVMSAANVAVDPTVPGELHVGHRG
jgi:hypothetical protein